MLISDGTDYLAIPVELSLSNFTQVSCFFLNIEDDDLAEGTENVILLLSTSRTTQPDGIILSPSQLIITINDNDGGS